MREGPRMFLYARWRLLLSVRFRSMNFYFIVYGIMIKDNFNFIYQKTGFIHKLYLNTVEFFSLCPPQRHANCKLHIYLDFWKPG